MKLSSLAPDHISHVDPPQQNVTHQTIARGKQDRLAVRRRVALSRVVSAFLVASTTASCVLLQRSGLIDLALGRMSVAVVGVLWFMSTFTEVRCAVNGAVPYAALPFMLIVVWLMTMMVVVVVGLLLLLP